MKLFFRSYGEGFPLIILHGLLGMSDNWVSFAKHLSKKNRRIIIPDLRNHGQSSHSNTMNYEAMTDDILELVNYLNIKQFDILGHSMGGKTAMLLALEHSEIINKLIVIDIAPRKYQFTTIELLETMLNIDLSIIQKRKDLEEILQKRINNLAYINLVLKNIQFHSQSLSWKPNLMALEQNLENIFSPILSANKYHKPTLFIKGADSNYITNEDEINITNQFTQAKFTTIKNANHWVHVDNYNDFFTEVFFFLTLNSG